MSNTALLGSYGAQDSSSLMFRNRIINGDMRIDQRNAGTKSTTITNTYVYGIDRFATFTQTGGSASLQRQSLASSDLPFSQEGLKYFLRYNREATVGATNDAHFFAQQIEANNIEDFNFGTSGAKQFTVSFWAKSSASYNFSLSLANTSVGATRTYVIPFNVTTTWQKYSYTITADTTGTWGTGENLGLSVRFVLGGGGSTATFNQWKSDNNYTGGSTQFQAQAQNSFFDVTGLQVEAGSVATPFERRPLGTELALCQRYYEKSYDLGVAPGSNSNPGRVSGVGTASGTTSVEFATVHYRVPKRIAVQPVIYNPGGVQGQINLFTAGWAFITNLTAAIDTFGDAGFEPAGGGGSGLTAGGIYGYYFHWTSNAEL